MPNLPSNDEITRFDGIYVPVSALASNWLEYYANCTPTPEENDQYSANHFKAHAANESTFISAQL
jgi:hypothetical protein